MLLALFALLAGAGTALSPCVLPVLPAVLSAGATGGRRRPLGVVTGLAVTFTSRSSGSRPSRTASGSAPASRATWRSPRSRCSAIVTLCRRSATGSRRAFRRWPATGRSGLGDGFGSGLVAGAALGFVYAPCAGPILAAVIAVGAASGRVDRRRAPRSRSAAPLVLLALALGGRALIDRVARRPRRAAAPRARGGHDRHGRRYGLPARRALPVVDRRPPAGRRRQPHASRSRPRAPSATAWPGCGRARASPRRRPPPTARCLPVLGRAPEFTGNQRWFNTRGRRAAQPAGAARPRGADRLLDLHLHQLPAHAALPPGVGREVPQARADDRRRTRARVRLREGRRQRVGGDPARGHPLSGRAGQRVRHLAAPGATSTGRPSTWSTHAGRVRSVEAGEGGYAEKEQAIRRCSPSAARRGSAAARGHATWSRRVPRRPRRPTSAPPARGASSSRRWPARASTRTARRPTTSSRSREAGRSTTSRRPRCSDARIDADRAGAPRLPGAVVARARGAPCTSRSTAVPAAPCTVREQRLYELVDLEAARAATGCRCAWTRACRPSPSPSADPARSQSRPVARITGQ